MKTKTKPRHQQRHVLANAATVTASHRLPVSLSSSFDPSLPLDGSLIVADVLRDQFNALNDDIQTRATDAELTAEVAALDADIAQRATLAQLNNAVNSLSADIATRATNDALNNAVAGLNANIDTRATVDLLNATVASAISGTSSNSNGVGSLDISASINYDQWQFQQVIDKLNELISALRR